MTATDVQLFAELSASSDGVVQPTLTLTTALGLLFRESGFLPRALLALTNLHSVEFGAPVQIGDTIRLESTIQSLKRVSGQPRGIVEVAFRALNQRDEVVVSGRLSVLAASVEQV